MTERSIVLIDAENVIHGWRCYCARNNLSDKIDYKKLVARLADGTNLLRAYFYDGVEENIPPKKKSFLNALQNGGIQLRTKILKGRFHRCPSCGAENERLVQKGVDVSLATDILRHAWQQTCEVCIIVSGDEDYMDAINVAKDKGVKVWVASFHASLSRDLKNSADRTIYLDDIFREVRLEPTEAAPATKS